MINNLVSIVMPAFNAEKTVKAAIESIINQSYQNWELIICDDCSSDRTIDIVKEFKDSRIITIDNIYKKGAAGARNSCIDIAKGDFLAFLDSDDLWGSEKLITQLKFMISNELDFSYGSYYIFTYSSLNVKGVFHPSDKIIKKDLLKSCDVGCLTVMLRVSSYPEFRFPYIAKEDYAAWILCTQNGLVMKRYPGVHAYYRLSNYSLSSNKYKEILRQFRVVRDFGKLNLFKSIYCVSCYIVLGILKHKLRYKSCSGASK